MKFNVSTDDGSLFVIKIIHKSYLVGLRYKQLFDSSVNIVSISTPSGELKNALLLDYCTCSDNALTLDEAIDRAVEAIGNLEESLSGVLLDVDISSYVRERLAVGGFSGVAQSEDK